MKLWQALVYALILSLLSGGGALVGGSGAATANVAPQEARGFVLPFGGALRGDARVASSPTEDRATEMVQLINQQRAAYGLPRLVEARGLDAAARDHDAWMAAHNDFCHECPGEPQIGARTGKYGYSWSGEIIAGGPPTPAEAVRAWMESPGHRAAILSDAVTVGCDLFAVTSPAVGQFPFYETCDFSRDPLHDAPLLTSTPAPSSTPSRVFLPTLTATPMPTITPAPTWTPYAVWPTPNRTIMPPLTLASPTPTATPSAGGAYWLTITLSPWSGASLQTQASRWLCGQFGVTCRWEVR